MGWIKPENKMPPKIKPIKPTMLRSTPNKKTNEYIPRKRPNANIIHKKIKLLRKIRPYFNEATITTIFFSQTIL